MRKLSRRVANLAVRAGDHDGRLPGCWVSCSLVGKSKRFGVVGAHIHIIRCCSTHTHTHTKTAPPPSSVNKQNNRKATATTTTAAIATATATNNVNNTHASFCSRADGLLISPAPALPSTPRELTYDDDVEPPRECPDAAPLDLLPPVELPGVPQLDVGVPDCDIVLAVSHPVLPRRGRGRGAAPFSRASKASTPAPLPLRPCFLKGVEGAVHTHTHTNKT